MKLLKYLVAISILNLMVVAIFTSATKILNGGSGLVPNALPLEVATQSAVISQPPSGTQGNSVTSVTAAPATDTTPAPSQAPIPSQAPVQANTQVQEQVQAQAQPNTAPSGCVVKIDNQTYDLNAFRALHSGGDIFQCGTDMTAVFYGQHSADYLASLSRYRIQ